MIKKKSSTVEVSRDGGKSFQPLIGFHVEEPPRPRVGQYIQLKKTIAAVKAEPEHNFRGHPEIPEGSWVKVTGHKMDRNYMNIEYKAEDGQIYNTTPLLYPEEYHILPATDDTEVARILYDNKG